MKVNFYEKYLKKHLRTELEELDLNKVREFLTKKSPDSLNIKGVNHLFKKDFFYRLIPYIFLIGLICMMLSFISVIQIDFNKSIFFIDIASHLNKLIFGFFFSAFYTVYFSSQRRMIIEEILKEKLSELENDIFGYKKINKILTQNIQ